MWLQCFALYVGVLAPRFPLEVPELMAYMIAIIRAAQEYEGPAWAAYDAAYRRQAVAQGLTKWSQINPSLYAICFTGKAKKVDRCDRCFSATHKAEDDPDVAKRLKAIESAVMALTRPPPVKKPAGTLHPGLPQLEQERLFLPGLPLHPPVRWMRGQSPDPGVPVEGR